MNHQHQTNNMKRYLIPATAFVFAIGFMVSCGKTDKETVAVEEEPVIETFNLQKEKLSSEIKLPAELAGFHQVDLYAKVSSFVKELKVDIGSEVKAGQLLIVLEAPEVSSQLAAAQ